MAPTTLKDWLAHLESLHPKTIALGLDRVNQVKQCLKLEPAFTIITVGGTNGKGSTCAMLENILNISAYTTGLYTSPHLLRYNERVRLNREAVNDAALCEAFEAVENARGEAPLTYFEFGTLAAVWLFVRERVDVAILEVGLGGRLDAVNAFDSSCAIVTNIGIDHTEYLGKTLAAIGIEKAGIYRPHRPAIFGDTQLPSTVRDHARSIDADLLSLGEAFRFSRQDTQWQFHGRRGNHYGLPYPALRGGYQLNNASAALAALDELREVLPVTLQDIKRGLLELDLPGRFQVLPGRPTVILDVAHNPAAVKVLAQQLGHMGRFRKTHAVFGMLKDKDIGGVVNVMTGLIDIWHLGSINAARGASAEDLLMYFSDGRNEDVSCYPSVAAAYNAACRQAEQDDRILVFGSFYTVAEVLKVC
ncbi:MAG: bifunctional tetrahydrofolate synthase/dihydrofolate synthase [Pseudomonadota bacterium]|nr:bifunctional tetrahydrofolate synthase/dihydrofolate synthase [Pseudomonadota bacterium]